MRSVIKFVGILCLILAGAAMFPQGVEASFGAPSIICGQGFSSSAPTCSGAGATCASSGDLVVISLSYYQSSGAQTISGWSDTNSDSFTQDADSATGANNYRTYMFHTVANSSSCTTYTATISGTVSFGNLSITKSSGGTGATTDAVATPLTFSSNANPQVGPNLTTSQTGDLIIAIANCAEGSNGWGAGSGYTQLDTTYSSNAWKTEYQIVGGAGTYNATFSNSQTCSFGTSIGNLVTVAYKTGAATPRFRSHSSIISFHPHSRKIPWSDRRRRLEMSKI